MLYYDYFICLLMYLNLLVMCINMDRKNEDVVVYVINGVNLFFY